VTAELGGKFGCGGVRVAEEEEGALAAPPRPSSGQGVRCPEDGDVPAVRRASTALCWSSAGGAAGSLLQPEAVSWPPRPECGQREPGVLTPSDGRLGRDGLFPRAEWQLPVGFVEKSEGWVTHELLQ